MSINRLMETARPTRQFVRYIVAILIANLAGLLVQVAAAAFVDLVLGYEFTGGWSLNAPNVIVMCIVGATVGCIAGAIARKRGMLISAIAVFFPLEDLVLLALIKNRDMSDYIETIFDTKRALWACVALIPAMICGHFSSKVARQRQLLSSKD
jgi:uncharacterized membrane protein (GlpM family)